MGLSEYEKGSGYAGVGIKLRRVVHSLRHGHDLTHSYYYRSLLPFPLLVCCIYMCTS